MPAVPFIRAISGTSPTSQLNVTFLQTSATERWPQPRTTDSGVQLPQCRYLCDVGGKHPGETILAKQPARPPLLRSGGGPNRASMGDVQIGDEWHRRNKGWEPARQRIPCDVSAVHPLRMPCRGITGKLRCAWACARAVLRQLRPWQRNQTRRGSQGSPGLLRRARFRSKAVEGSLGQCGNGHGMRLLLRVYAGAHR